MNSNFNKFQKSQRLLKPAIAAAIRRRTAGRTKSSILDFVVCELSLSGFQYGHRVSQWNQLCVPSYLFLYFSLSHLVFNLSISFSFIRRAVLFIRQLFGRGARLLCAEGHYFSLVSFLGNSLFRDRLVNGFLTSKWLGGTLTNWSRLVRRTLKRLKQTKVLSTSTQEYVYGLRRFKFLPNIFFLFSATTAPVAALEASHLALPTVGVVDSDTRATTITYPIFGNDNSAQSLYYLLFLVVSARVAGHCRRFKTLKRLLKHRIFYQFRQQRALRIHKGFSSFLNTCFAQLIKNVRNLLADKRRCRLSANKQNYIVTRLLYIRDEAYRVALHLKKFGVFKNPKILYKLRKITWYIKFVFGVKNFGLKDKPRSIRSLGQVLKFKQASVFSTNARAYGNNISIKRNRRRFLKLFFKGLAGASRKALSSVFALFRKVKKTHKGFRQGAGRVGGKFKRKKRFFSSKVVGRQKFYKGVVH